MSEFVHARVSDDDSAARRPVLGVQTQKVLDGLEDNAKASVRDDSLRILSRCNSFYLAADSTSSAQLVVGEVQSGKTLSFTTVMALARDNRFPLIIVLAGTKNNLLNQTEKRLKRDLGMIGDGGPNPWRTWTNPASSDSKNIAQLLALWPDSSIPTDFKQTAVLFVLKHAGRINAVAEMLAEVIEHLPTGQVDALIVDDEADQASLNVKASRGQESPVYEAVQTLRFALPHHTYLMYTATPQAPLLISIADALSPERVTVLTAGSDYIGGDELFKRSDSQFVRQILDRELAGALDPAAEVAPQSLEDALAFWVLALVVAQQRGTPRPLSMLVHPAATKDLHAKYDSWVRALLNRWRAALADRDDVAYEDVVTNRFEKAYNDLRRTVVSLPSIKNDRTPLDKLLADARLYLPLVEQRIVNSESTAEIPEDQWKQFVGWIVIGGNKLDRGFTVQNLAVTYMPRGSGVGNADTIQQRGRFFGYKRSYLDLCRGWFSNDLARIFKSYVEHERSMQHELRIVDNANGPLKAWRRKFLLDPGLRPTRKQVMTLPTSNGVIGRGWAFRQVDLYDSARASANLESLDIIRKLLLQDGTPDMRDKRVRRSDSLHHTAPWSYRPAVELLESWACSPREKEELDQILFIIASAIDDNEMPQFQVIGIDNLEDRTRSPETLAGVVRRPLRINNLFQGRGSTDNYLGDDKFRDKSAVSIQVHNVVPMDEKGVRATPTTSPALALSLPDGWARRVYWGLST